MNCGVQSVAYLWREKVENNNNYIGPGFTGQQWKRLDGKSAFAAVMWCCHSSLPRWIACCLRGHFECGCLSPAPFRVLSARLLPLCVANAVVRPSPPSQGLLISPQKAWEGVQYPVQLCVLDIGLSKNDLFSLSLLLVFLSCYSPRSWDWYLPYPAHGGSKRDSNCSAIELG